MPISLNLPSLFNSATTPMTCLPPILTNALYFYEKRTIVFYVDEWHLNENNASYKSNISNFQTYLKCNRGCRIQVLGMFCFDAKFRLACVHAGTLASNTLYVHGPTTNLVVLPLFFPCLYTNISNSYDAFMKSKRFF